MSQLPFYLLAFVVVLGVLIVVHEFGHYLAARYCGVRVLRFSVGFGRTLWQRRLGSDGTEWAIGAFPLGGYVKMLDEREGEVAPEECHRAFNRQSVGKRSLIVVAGPLANFILAILLYWVVFMMGSNELLPILGTPPASSPAASAGIVNGEQVRTLKLSWFSPTTHNYMFVDHSGQRVAVKPIRQLAGEMEKGLARIVAPEKIKLPEFP